MIKKIIIALSFTFLTSCNTTKLVSIKDPAYEGYFIKSIMISVDGNSLEDQIKAENAFIESIPKLNISAYKKSELFPPTRTYTIEQIIEETDKRGIETILAIKAKDHDFYSTYIPPTYHQGSATSKVHGYGNYATVTTTYNPGYTTGGYSINKPIMNVDVLLFDVKKKVVIWKAEGKSGGNASSSFSDLTASAAKASVTELIKSGLILE